MSDCSKPKKKFSTILYNLFFKRTSSYALALIFSSIWFERIFDHATETLFERYNEGRLWMHIKDRYPFPKITYEDLEEKPDDETQTQDMVEQTDEDQAQPAQPPAQDKTSQEKKPQKYDCTND